MVPVPFRLKVPGKDLSSVGTVAWTTFRLEGLLSFDSGALRIQWSGTGLLDAVTGVDVRSEVVPIPSETLVVPLEQIRSARLLGGWWRPRLELTANDLDTLRSVPSEDGGRLRFWLALGDRRLATQVVAELHRVARARSGSSASGPPLAPPYHTPSNGAV